MKKRTIVYYSQHISWFTLESNQITFGSNSSTTPRKGKTGENTDKTGYVFYQLNISFMITSEDIIKN